MSFTGDSPKANRLRLAPLSADPVNPAEGDIFRSDGTPRAVGLWVYQGAAWVPLRTGGASDFLVVASINSAASPYTVLPADEVIFADTSAGNITLNLPTAVGIAGKVYRIKKTNSANTATVDAAGAETIDGSLTFKLYAANEEISVISDGTNYKILNHDFPAVVAEFFGDSPTGRGSTFNKVRRGYTIHTNTLAPYATYAESSTEGSSITINVAGYYSFVYSDADSGSTEYTAITVNGTALTTTASVLTYAQGRRASGYGSPGFARATLTAYLNVGDVVRPQDDGGSNIASIAAVFTANFLGRK